jgi:membrane fusion protein, multidrug efflux system
MKKSLIVQIIAVTVVITAIITGVLVYFHYSKKHPSSNNATVHSHRTTIAAQINGQVTDVLVKNHQLVSANTPLFKIDCKTYQSQLKQAQAQLSNTTNNIEALQKKLAANQALVKESEAKFKIAKEAWLNAKKELRQRNIISQTAYNNALYQKEAAEQAVNAATAQAQATQDSLGKLPITNNPQIKAAQAAVNQAVINTNRCIVFSPTSGFLGRLSLRPGDIVTVSQPLFTITNNDDYWVEANFKETKISRIKPGQPVTITLDSYPDETYQGKVASFSASTGSVLAILPTENASGNWVKVTQRVPIRIKITNPKKYHHLLINGQSATVTVDTTAND